MRWFLLFCVYFADSFDKITRCYINMNNISKAVGRIIFNVSRKLFVSAFFLNLLLTL